jgi:hypothetical protein
MQAPDMPMRSPQQQISSPMMMARIMQMARMGLFGGQGQGGNPYPAIGAGAGNAGGMTGANNAGNPLLAYLLSQGLMGQ